MKERHYDKIELDAYSQWLSVQRLAPRSISAYRVRVKNFLVYNQFNSGTSYQYHAESLSVQCQRYLNFLSNDGAPAASLNATAVALESYGRFRGVPFRLNRQTVTKSRRMLTQHEQLKFSEAALAFGGAKAQAIGLLIYNTGMSVTRLSELDISDYDAKSGTIRKDLDWVVLDLLTTTALNQWLALRTLTADPAHTALFINKAGKRMSPPGIEYFIRRVAQKGRVDVSPTALKQTFRAGMLSPLSRPHARMPESTTSAGFTH